MNTMKGWIKLYRAVFDNPTVTKSAEHLAVWIYLLTHATPGPYKSSFGGREITLRAGQLITSRNSISAGVNGSISDSKVQRVLKAFENAHQIEQLTCNKSRLITLTNWAKYQNGEQQAEHQANNKRTAAEQQPNTNREYKEYENNKNSFNRDDFVSHYLDEEGLVLD